MGALLFLLTETFAEEITFVPCWPLGLIRDNIAYAGMCARKPQRGAPVDRATHIITWLMVVILKMVLKQGLSIYIFIR